MATDNFSSAKITDVADRLMSADQPTKFLVYQRTILGAFAFANTPYMDLQK